MTDFGVDTKLSRASTHAAFKVLSARNITEARTDFQKLVEYLDSVIRFAIDEGSKDDEGNFNSYEGLAETGYAERQLDNLLIDHGKDLKEQFLNNGLFCKRCGLS